MVRNLKSQFIQNNIDYSEIRDKEDFLNIHKMYLDLDNIEKEIYTDEKEFYKFEDIDKNVIKKNEDKDIVFNYNF
jgi:hypothetical protein